MGIPTYGHTNVSWNIKFSDIILWQVIWKASIWKFFCAIMTLLYEEWDDHNHEDKRSNKVQIADTCQNLKRYITLVSLYVIVAKFSHRVLHHLASSLLNVVSQIDRQADKNSSLGNLFSEFSIWHLELVNCFLCYIWLWKVPISIVSPACVFGTIAIT